MCPKLRLLSLQKWSIESLASLGDFKGLTNLDLRDDESISSKSESTPKDSTIIKADTKHENKTLSAIIPSLSSTHRPTQLKEKRAHTRKKLEKQWREKATRVNSYTLRDPTLYPLLCIRLNPRTYRQFNAYLRRYNHNRTITHVPFTVNL